MAGSSRLLAMGLALFAAAQPAMAQAPCPPPANDSYQGEMRFTVQDRPGQRPVLIAEGLIDHNVVPRLEAALATFAGDEIWLRSPGGYVGADRDAGRLIRSRGLRTRVPADWTCRGACTIMFFGGVERTVEAGGLFIVNMFAHTGNVDNVVEIGGSSRMIATEDYDYLIRMGVSPRLLTDIMYREPVRNMDAPGYCITSAELDEYRINTGPAVRRVPR